jgi:hypothetical protein
MIDLNAHHFSKQVFIVRPLGNIHIKRVFSNSSSFTGVIEGFKGVTTLSTMIESSPTLTKTKRVAETIWYFHSEGVDAFI